jgi:hypothetical protein
MTGDPVSDTINTVGNIIWNAATRIGDLIQVIDKSRRPRKKKLDEKWRTKQRERIRDELAALARKRGAEDRIKRAFADKAEIAKTLAQRYAEAFKKGKVNYEEALEINRLRQQLGLKKEFYADTLDLLRREGARQVGKNFRDNAVSALLGYIAGMTTQTAIAQLATAAIMPPTRIPDPRPTDPDLAALIETPTFLHLDRREFYYITQMWEVKAQLENMIKAEVNAYGSNESPRVRRMISTLRKVYEYLGVRWPDDKPPPPKPRRPYVRRNIDGYPID